MELIETECQAVWKFKEYHFSCSTSLVVTLYTAPSSSLVTGRRSVLFYCHSVQSLWIVRSLSSLTLNNDQVNNEVRPLNGIPFFGQRGSHFSSSPISNLQALFIPFSCKYDLPMNFCFIRRRDDSIKFSFRDAKLTRWKMLGRSK